MYTIFRSLFFGYLPKGTLASGLLLCLVWVFPCNHLHAQETKATASERLAWASTIPKRTLLVVYPTFSVKHQRIRSSVRNLTPEAKGWKQAEQIMRRDRAHRDTLIRALSASFIAEYTFGSTLLMPDTSYIHWQKGQRNISLLDLQLQPVAAQTWADTDVLIVRKRKSNRDTGTGMEIWFVEAPDRVALPKKFPDEVREASIGSRFVRFFEAFFTFSDNPDTVQEQRVVTDYLARQLNRKLSKYIYSFED